MPVRRVRKRYPSSHKPEGLVAKLSVRTTASTSKVHTTVSATAGVKQAGLESMEHTITNQPVEEVNSSIFSFTKSTGHFIYFSAEHMHGLAKFPTRPIFLDFFPHSL